MKFLDKQREKLKQISKETTRYKNSRRQKNEHLKMLHEAFDEINKDKKKAF